MAQDDQKPPGPPAGGPRIHVDSDWKKQAQAEKERLAKEIESGPAPSAAGQAAAGAGEESALPPASFETLVQTLATQAAIFLSEQPDPETGRPVRHLDLAKHNIDLLRILEEKTKGNLTDAEKRLLETVLYELLMAYVNASS